MFSINGVDFVEALPASTGIREQTVAPLEGCHVKDIVTDDDLLCVLNDLRHGLKAGHPMSPLRHDFTAVIAEFCRKWGLDEDPHCFAEWPKDPTAPVNLQRDRPVAVAPLNDAVEAGAFEAAKGPVR